MKHSFKVTATRNIGGKINKETEMQKRVEDRIVPGTFQGGKGLSVMVESNNPVSPNVATVVEALKKHYKIEIKGSPSIDFFKVEKI